MRLANTIAIRPAGSGRRLRRCFRYFSTSARASTARLARSNSGGAASIWLRAYFRGARRRRIPEECPACPIGSRERHIAARSQEEASGPEESRRPKYAYFPFSGGPRKCIGDGFAQLEAPILLATILQRCVLRLARDAVVVPEPTVTLRPKHGLRVIATRA